MISSQIRRLKDKNIVFNPIHHKVFGHLRDLYLMATRSLGHHIFNPNIYALICSLHDLEFTLSLTKKKKEYSGLLANCGSC